jgi:hemoglobin
MIAIASVVALAASAGLAGCSAPTRHDTLYDDLGGTPGISAIVDQVIEAYADDPRVAPFFANTNIHRFRSKLIEYLCVVADGPCTYTGDSMEESHTGLGIDEASFNAGVEGFQKAMTNLRLPQTTQNRLLARLAPRHESIIHR